MADARAELRAAFADLRRALDRVERAIDTALAPPAEALPEPDSSALHLRTDPVPVSAPASTPVPAPAPEPLPERPPAPKPVRMAALRAFALEDLNRWLASGTIFQIRGDLAYLNPRALGGQKVDEMMGHIRRMGFDEELGVLLEDGLRSEVFLFRRSVGPA